MELRDKDRLDQWLDGALQQYGEAEPRAGLEGRVLAKVRAAPAQRFRWPIWVAVAASIAIGGVIFVASGNKEAQKKALVAQKLPVSRLEAPESARTVQGGIGSTSRKQRRKRTVHVEEADEPRLTQFPSPTPLTEQEKILARYVQERPEEAQMVARAQTELVQRDLREFTQAPQPPGSQQGSSK